MKRWVFALVCIVMYAVFIACLACALILFKNESGTQMMALSAISSALMLFTLIMALLYTRETPSEKYKEMYMQEKEEEKKD